VLLELNHPFLVKTYGTFKDENNLYILMELIQGGELFNYIRRAGRLPNQIAKIYSAEIILAFEYLHDKHIMYRDLKPENILIHYNGHIKITDFGFSKKIRNRTFSMCGTPEYIAPEIILNKGHNTAVDWWSLGILIFEMLAGYPPFVPDEKKTIFEAIISSQPDIPYFFMPAAKDIIQTLLVVDSEKRVPGGATELKKHPWFSDIDWDQLLNQPTGPLNPEIEKDADTHNFYKYSDELIDDEKDEKLDYEKIFEYF